MPQPTSDRLLERRRFLLPAIASLVCAFIAMGAIVLVAAQQQNRLAAERTHDVVEALVNQRLNSLRRLAVDYSWWDAAVENLTTSVNLEWADDNIGTYLADQFEIGLTLVIDSDNRISYAAHDGQRQRTVAFGKYLGVLAPGLAAVRAQDPAEPTGHAAFALIDDRIYGLGFGAITPQRSAVGVTPSRNVLILGLPLDAAFLSTMEDQFKIEGLTLESSQPDDASTIPLADPNGYALGALSWTPPRPGQNWVKVMVPGLAVLFLIVMTLAFRVYSVWRETCSGLVSRSRELAEARDGADSANRAKSVFLANMSHELRTPLNAIIGFSSVMNDQMLGPIGSQRYRDYARDIFSTSRHLLSIINELLDLASIEAGRAIMNEDSFQASDALAEAIRLTSSEFAQIRFVDATDPAFSAVIRADRVKIVQILTNLLSNAAKASPSDEAVYAVAVVETDGRLSFSVSDAGPGMDTETMRALLTPFSRNSHASRFRYGYGIGLAVSRKLAELHDAELKLAARPGNGTIATLTLPPTRVLQTPAVAAAPHR